MNLRPFLGFLPLAATLLACSPPHSVELGRPEQVDTGGDAFTGPFCNEYAGMLSARSRWSYAIATADLTGTDVVSTTTFAADEVTTEEALHLVASDGSSTLDVAGTRVWGCEGGDLVLREDGVESEEILDGVTVVHSVLLTYDPPLLTTPATLEPGGAWVATAAGTSVVDGQTTTFDYEIAYSVVGVQKVSVPAGNFEAVEIRGRASLPTGPFDDHRFLAAGIGSVIHDEIYKLASYRGE